MAYGPFNAGGGTSGGGAEKIIGTGAPTASTVGKVGQDYFDRTTGTTYTCVAVSGSTYTWEISGTRDASKIEIGEGAEKTALDLAIEQIKKDVENAKPLSGTTDPTESTKGAIGQTYTNTATGKIWTCVAADDELGVYAWEVSGGGGSVLQLYSIKIAHAPTKTAYKAGETFNPAGMTVTADYAIDGHVTLKDVEVTGFTFDQGALAAGTTSIVITYSEGGITKTATQAISVSKTKLNVPTFGGSLTYNGAEQTPSFSGEQSAYMTKSGDVKATNAGNYTAKFTLKNTDYYEWADGSTGTKSVSWSIGKKTPVISASPSSVTLDTTHLTAAAVITTDGDGALSAASGDTSVATASMSGKNVSISHVNQKSGETDITISLAAGTNYKAGSVTIHVKASFVPDDVDSASWDTISAVSAAGLGDTYWDAGDCKKIRLNGNIGEYLTLSNKDVYVFILGFNHNSAKGETQGILWGGFKTAKTNGTLFALFDSKYSPDASWATYTDGHKHFTMNHSQNTNVGGWKGCDFRYDILGACSSKGADATAATKSNPPSNTLAAALPADLRSVLKLRTHYVDNTGNSSNVAANVTAVVDLISLMAEFEIFGARTYANQYEKDKQAQFAYFAAGNAHQWFKETAASTGLCVWEASPFYYDAAYFCYVNNNGNADYDVVDCSLALAAAFLT